LKPDIKLDASQLINMMSGGGGSSSGSSSSSSSSSSGGGLGGGLLGGMLGGLLGGGASGSSSTSSGSPSGAAALASAGPMAGIIQGQATQFIETIKSSVREVRLTVTWKDGTVTQNLSASQIVVILANSVGKAGQTQGGATSGSGDTATLPANGSIGIPPPGGQR
jgi:hypothetical protein